MAAVAAAQKNREMFAIKKSYSIEVSFIWFFFLKLTENFFNFIESLTLTSSGYNYILCFIIIITFIIIFIILPTGNSDPVNINKNYS